MAIAGELESQASAILEQNTLDVASGRAKGLSDALLDRLSLTEERIANLAADTRRIASLPDPVGTEIESRVLPNGIRLSRRRIPIGVLGVIYEARPNVTIDIATLCLKTGNAVILRGGSESRRSNLALVKVIQVALAILRGHEGGAVVIGAGPGDFDQEWLSLVLGVKVAAGLDEAIAHIQAHSTGHSDGILTNDWRHATRFVNEIDSAAVFVNASTRLNDGGQFGLGAEVAISTQKLHARGPMGLEALTTYKWIVYGNMHVRV